MTAHAVPPRPCLKDIVALVGREAGVLPSDIHGQGRPRRIAEARQVAYWVARHATGASYERIGAAIGGRDHATVRHGVRKVDARLATDPRLTALRDRVLAGLGDLPAEFARREARRLEAVRVEAAARAQARLDREAEFSAPSGVAWYEKDASIEGWGYSTPRGKFIQQNEAYVAAVLEAHPELKAVSQARQGEAA